MSKRIPIIKIYNQQAKLVYIPYKYLSKKQKEHFVEYYISHMES